MSAENKVRSLASRAIRLCAEDGRLGSFEQHEKTIVDNMDFLYWLVWLAELDEREACAKLCLETEPFYGKMFADAIRARGQA